jgi:phosphoribosylanthranilate isomerase
VTKVKICGITTIEDALMAVAAGADALGFVFAPSPRQVTPETAASILRELPPFVTTVAVLVDQDPAPILDRCPLDVLQFHGSEPPEEMRSFPGVRAIKAFRVRASVDLEDLHRYHEAADALLLDAYVPGIAGGSGATFPWALAREAVERGLVASAHGLGNGVPPLILAGGLTPENVAAAIAAAAPYAVDVSSGVEAAPGRKDPAKVRAFVKAALGSWSLALGPMVGNTASRAAGIPAKSQEPRAKSREEERRA